MNRAIMRSNLQSILADVSWDATELNMAIAKAIGDLERFLPDEKVKEVTWTETITKEGWTSGIAHGTYVSLTHKPIKWATEVVANTAGTITYTRDTDYTMDYRNGKITTISGGSLVVATAYHISYTRFKEGVDISSLTDLIRVTRVEYPIGSDPTQPFIPFAVWGTVLYLSPTTLSDKRHVVIYYESQVTAPDDTTDGSFPRFLDEVILDGASGYALMTRAIRLANLSKENLELSAVDLVAIDHTDSRTALTNAAAQIVLAATALGKVTTYLEGVGDSAKYWLNKITTDIAGLRTAFLTAVDAANTALDGVSIGGITIDLTDADTALDKVVVYLTTNSNDNMLYWLGKITTDIAPLRTAIGIALDASNTSLDAINFSDVTTHLGLALTALGKVATYLENNTAEDSKSWLTKITTDIANLRTALATALTASKAYIDKVGVATSGDLDLAAAVWTDEVKHILTQAGIPNAEDFLELGDDTIDITAILTEAETALDKIATEVAAGKTHLTTGVAKINTVNVGDNVPEMYRDYASIQNTLADGYRTEAGERLSKATSQHSQTELYLRFAEIAISMAQVWAAKRADYLNQANTRSNAASVYMAEAAQRIDNLRSYIDQADGWGRIASGFVNEAAGRAAIIAQIIGAENTKVNQASGYIAEATTRIDNLRSYLQQASAWADVASGFVSEAIQRVSMANAVANGQQIVVNQALAYLSEASVRIDNLRTYIEQAAAYARISDGFIAEANSRITSATGYLNEATLRNAINELLIRQSETHITIASNQTASSTRFMELATDKRNEFWSILRNKMEIRRGTSLVSQRQ